MTTFRKTSARRLLLALAAGTLTTFSCLPAAGDIRTTSAHNSARSAVMVGTTAAQPDATLDKRASVKSYVTFADEVKTTYMRGSKKSIKLAVVGKLPADADVYIQAWDHAARKLPAGFGHRLDVTKTGELVISTEKLDVLPVGKMEIQVLTRFNGKPRATARLDVTISAPAPQAVAVNEPVLQIIAPTHRFQGDSTGLAVKLVGELPPKGDVLIIAWDHQTNSLVRPFAVELKKEPWGLSSGKMDQLAPGKYTMQALLRANGRVIDRQEHQLTVTEPGEVVVPGVVFDKPLAKRVIGDKSTLVLKTTADLPQGSDLLVQAWSVEKNALVGGFAFELAGTDREIPAAKLDLLPAGENDIQVLARLDDKVVDRVSHSLMVMEPVVTPAPVDPTPVDVAPTAAFDNCPASVVEGSAVSLPIAINGVWADNNDAVVQAWSITDSRLVSGFASVVDIDSPTVAATRVAALTPGDYEVQLLMRQDGKVIEVVRHGLQVTPKPQPTPDPNPEPTTPDVDPTAPDADPTTPAPEPTVPDGTPMPDVTPDPIAPPDTEPTPEPTPMKVTFAASTPGEFKLGSSTTLQLDVTGDVPDDADVLVISWSTAENAMVAGFPHVLAGEPWTISNVKLGQLPAGVNVLQCLVRRNNVIVDRLSHDLLVVDPNAPEQPDLADNPDTNNTEDGWTVFPVAADARTIYVSSSRGSDSNSGASPNSPLRTISRGMEKLRNGYPDRLMLRRGDTFRVNSALELRASGRSADYPLVIGAYGDLSTKRPKIESSGGRFLYLNAVSNVAILDLHGVAYKRVPGSSSYDSAANDDSEGFIQSTGQRINNLHIEGCLMEYFSVAITLQKRESNDPSVTNVTIRRNVTRYSYRTGGAHSHGMFFRRVEGLKLIENIFDHNGWSEKVGGANPSGFNHNVYLAEVKKATLKGNIFARSSGLDTKFRSDQPNGVYDTVIQENLWCDSFEALAMSVDWTGRDNMNKNIRNTKISRNVFTRTGRHSDNKFIGRSIVIDSISGMQIEHNVFVDNDDAPTRSPAIDYEGWDGAKDLKISGNVAYDWVYFADYPKFNLKGNGQQTGNLIDPPGDRLMDSGRNLPKFVSQVAKKGSVSSWYDGFGDQRKGNWSDKWCGTYVTSWIREGMTLRPFD